MMFSLLINNYLCVLGLLIFEKGAGCRMSCGKLHFFEIKLSRLYQIKRILI